MTETSQGKCVLVQEGTVFLPLLAVEKSGIQTPERIIQKGGKADPEDVGKEEKRRRLGKFAEQKNRQRNGRPEEQNFDKSPPGQPHSKKENGPGGVQNKLDKKNGQGGFDACGGPTPGPDEIGGNAHQEIEHDPDGAEQPGGGIE